MLDVACVDVGCWVFDVLMLHAWVLDVGCVDVGCWVLDVGCVDVGRWMC